MLQKKISIKTTTKGCTALMIATGKSRIKSSNEIVKYLIDVGADLNIRDNYGCTVLIYASRNSNTESAYETVKLLVNAGADLNIQDYGGYTALMLVTIYYNTESTIEIVKLLITSGANLYFKNISNKTAYDLLPIDKLKPTFWQYGYPSKNTNYKKFYYINYIIKNENKNS